MIILPIHVWLSNRYIYDYLTDTCMIILPIHIWISYQYMYDYLTDTCVIILPIHIWISYRYMYDYRTSLWTLFRMHTHTTLSCWNTFGCIHHFSLHIHQHLKQIDLKKLLNSVQAMKKMFKQHSAYIESFLRIKTKTWRF